MTCCKEATSSFPEVRDLSLPSHLFSSKNPQRPVNLFLFTPHTYLSHFLRDQKVLLHVRRLGLKNLAAHRVFRHLISRDFLLLVFFLYHSSPRIVGFLQLLVWFFLLFHSTHRQSGAQSGFLLYFSFCFFSLCYSSFRMIRVFPTFPHLLLLPLPLIHSHSWNIYSILPSQKFLSGFVETNTRHQQSNHNSEKCRFEYLRISRLPIL